MSDACLLVLCGIPGCGKSTLSKQLLCEDSVLSGHNTNCRWIHVCFDDLLTNDIEKSVIEENSEIRWGALRNIIHKAVDLTLALLLKNDLQSFVLEDGEMSQEEQHVMSNYENYVLSTVKQKSVKKDCQWVFIIDDNMYYRSMRYKYYQIARKYNIGFAQVLISCDIAVALERNSARPTPVPSEIISAMASKIEYPTKMNDWEKYSLSCDCTDLSSDLHDIYGLVVESMESPVQRAAETDFETREISRVACSQSLLHQADQIMRKCISKKFANLKDSGDKYTMKELFAQTQSVKATVLEKLRSGEILVPENLLPQVESASKEESNPLHVFISNTFNTIFECSGFTNASPGC